MDELKTVCEPDPEKPWVCQFSGYPGTVGWKSGFRFFRDEPLNQKLKKSKKGYIRISQRAQIPYISIFYGLN